MEKKRMNDKGFSLVELIIVIAIMAILIGVLAPQYLKFVERGRKSTDIQNVDEIIRAVQIYAADPMATNTPEATMTITLTTTKTDVDAAGFTGSAFVTAALQDIGINSVQLKSAKWTASGTVTITLTANADGTITATQTDADKTVVSGVTCDIVKGEYK